MHAHTHTNTHTHTHTHTPMFNFFHKLHCPHWEPVSSSNTEPRYSHRAVACWDFSLIWSFVIKQIFTLMRILTLMTILLWLISESTNIYKHLFGLKDELIRFLVVNGHCDLSKLFIASWIRYLKKALRESFQIWFKCSLVSLLHPN